MDTDLNLGITVTCDDCKCSRVFGRGELVIDPKLIARRYWRPDFFIDLVAALALPQAGTVLTLFLLYFFYLNVDF